MDLPSLENFEIEDVELIAAELSKDADELTLKLTCPVRGWRWKKAVPDGLRAMILGDRSLHYYVELRFLGASSLKGSFVDSTTTTLVPNLGSAGSPILEELHLGTTGSGRGKCFFEFDDGTLEFEFATCIQRELSST